MNPERTKSGSPLISTVPSLPSLVKFTNARNVVVNLCHDIQDYCGTLIVTYPFSSFICDVEANINL